MGISVSNHPLAQAIDTNKDGILQRNSEINLNAQTLQVLDTNQDLSVSADELSRALEQDKVIVNYRSGIPATIDLNPAQVPVKRDKAQGYIYGGGGLGTLAGMGVGALVSKVTGLPMQSCTQTGFIIGAVLGIGTGIGFSIYDSKKSD